MGFALRFNRDQLGRMLSGKSAEARALFYAGLREDVDIVTLELRGKVEELTLEKGKVGVSGQFKESITSEPAEFRPPSRVVGGVVAGRGGKDIAHAKFVEFGTGPHKAKKSPAFWRYTLGPWVKIKLRPTAGINPTTGKKQSQEGAIWAISTGIGRKIEDRGIKPSNIFGEVFEKHGPRALERLADLAFDRLAGVA